MRGVQIMNEKCIGAKEWWQKLTDGAKFCLF